MEGPSSVYRTPYLEPFCHFQFFVSINAAETLPAVCSDFLYTFSVCAHLARLLGTLETQICICDSLQNCPGATRTTLLTGSRSLMSARTTPILEETLANECWHARIKAQIP